MKAEEYRFSFQVYDSIEELPDADADLLKKAMAGTKNAYAPYSRFYVSAAAKLISGDYVTGTNQENASFPVGICAERVLLATASSVYPSTPIDTIAITYRSDTASSDHPIAPCGMCRQALQEFESRANHPIRVILGGLEGKIFVIPNVSSLLPFSFTSNELNFKPC